MKILILSILVFMSACANQPDRIQVSDNPVESPEGLTLVGRGVHPDHGQSIKLSEIDLYSTLHRYLGGAFDISSTLIEHELIGTRTVAHATTEVRSYTRLRLPPGAQVTHTCSQRKDEWSCSSSTILSPETVQALKSRHARKRQEYIRQNNDRDYILDVKRQHSTKSKIDKLNTYLGKYIHPSHDLDLVRLATSYLQQISYSLTEVIMVEGSEEVVLKIAVVDDNGCLDGFGSKLILPSGKLVAGRIEDCTQLSVIIPRPVYAGHYPLPFMLEYGGMMLGPSTLSLEVIGSTLRLASGRFHVSIEAIGRSPGIDINAKLEARGLARREWLRKAALVDIKQAKMTTEKVSTILQFGALTTEIKVTGE